MEGILCLINLQLFINHSQGHFRTAHTSIDMKLNDVFGVRVGEGGSLERRYLH